MVPKLKRLDVRDIKMDQCSLSTWSLVLERMNNLDTLCLKYQPQLEAFCTILQRLNNFNTLVLDATDNEDYELEHILGHATTNAKKTSFNIVVTLWNNQFLEYCLLHCLDI